MVIPWGDDVLAPTVVALSPPNSHHLPHQSLNLVPLALKLLSWCSLENSRAMNNLSDRIWRPIKTRSFFMSMRVPLFRNPKVTLMNLQIHHPLVLGKCNKFTSFLEIYVIMVGCNWWLSKKFHILLRFDTKLAARIDGTTIGGVAGVFITYHGCNRETPMVELVPINKHC